MSLELSPHIRKAVEVLGCPHVSSPEKAHKKLMTMLDDLYDELVKHGETGLLAAVDALRLMVRSKLD